MRLREFFAQLPREGWELDGPYVHRDELCPLSWLACEDAEYDLENGYHGAGEALGLPEILTSAIACAADDARKRWRYSRKNIAELRRLLLRHCGLSSK